jgi:hypothetical protein
VCVSRGHLEIVKLLIADGRNLGHEREDKHGDTAVDGALDGKHHEIVDCRVSGNSVTILPKPST